ncbi:phosphohistidine phosphatase SixA [Alkalispirillum mobile]|uniref:Phosphohistidine phosphatase SixA n=1 Tax=Alkalispirillum mobile TaxID=85925 RepID=A0A498C4P8_9GAMM|nr:histidine phosphatase family protein [Alkalispirillum mobile]RLK50735.1 phosphohistidine phosphatase SixA [Alkalispirillum mobile]
MWELILVRHAIAEDPPDDGSLPDAQRALTAKGRERMQAGAQGLRQSINACDQLLSSPLLRARQTADILAEHGPRPGARAVDEGLSPGADPTRFLTDLASGPASRSIAVGHEPDLSGLVALALTGQPRAFMHFKKGGALALGFAGPPAPGGAVLQWYLPARVLRTLARCER